MPSKDDAREALADMVRHWDTQGYTVAMRALDPVQTGQVFPVVMRWSKPRAGKPIPDAYCTITASLQPLPPKGVKFSSQFRIEHDSYVYSNDELSKLCGKLVARTIEAKERMAAAEGALDVIEAFDESRLPASYEVVEEEAAPTVLEHVERDEADRLATRIQAAARGRRERMRVARLKADRAARVEQDASAVKIQSLFRGHRTRREEPETEVWADEEAKTITEIHRVERDKLGHRRVQGLRAGGEHVAVRVSGQAAEEEKARVGDVEKSQEEQETRVVHEIAEAEQKAEMEAAAIRIQAIARGRAARNKVVSLKSKPAQGKKELIAAASDQVSHDALTALAAERLVEASAPPKEATAATKIQALHRGRTTRKAVAKKKESEETAAMRIQAAARGRAARKRVSQIRAHSSG
jgi:hypothetical protein